MQVANDVHGDEQAGDEKNGPKNGGKAGAQKAERKNKRQRPGRVAHNQGAVGDKSAGVLNHFELVVVVGIRVVSELLSGRPITDEIAVAGQAG